MPDNKFAAETRPPETPHTIPEDPEQSIYRFIIVAAKRARQLQSGAKPKVPVLARKMTRVAVEETRRGFVPMIDPEHAPPPEEQEPAADQ
jgi:DNA-directed RNA polymerase subunit omega